MLSDQMLSKLSEVTKLPPLVKLTLKQIMGVLLKEEQTEFFR